MQPHDQVCTWCGKAFTLTGKAYHSERHPYSWTTLAELLAENKRLRGELSHEEREMLS